MADRPIVSIVMCAYNVRAYLPTSVESVLAQTRVDFELLIVDDGSTDGTQTLCDRYAARDPRVRVLHVSNGGAAKARNAGIARARGDYLMFVDSDDACDSQYCERLVAAVESHDVDSAICGVDVFVDPEDAAAGVRGVEPAVFEVGAARTVAHDGCFGLFEFNTALWNKIFRRSVVVENGITFPPGSRHEDDAFWYQYAMCSGAAAVIPEKLYRYRIRRGSIMDEDGRKAPMNRRDFIESMEHVLDFAARRDLVGAHARFLVRIWLAVYADVARWFSEEECRQLRREFIRKTSGFASEDNRLAEAGERLVWINRRRRLSDWASWMLYGMVATFGSARAKRKAERSRAFLKGAE